MDKRLTGSFPPKRAIRSRVAAIVRLRPIADIAPFSYRPEMATLLHEYWEGDDGAEFAVVRERNDELRPSITPNARFVFSVLADSWHQAMQLQYDKLDFGTYDSVGVEDYVYSDEDVAEQEAYLKRRNVR